MASFATERYIINSSIRLGVVSIDLDRNLFRLASFPFRLCTSFNVLGDWSFITSSAFFGHALIPFVFTTWPRNKPSSTPKETLKGVFTEGFNFPVDLRKRVSVFKESLIQVGEVNTHPLAAIMVFHHHRVGKPAVVVYFSHDMCFYEFGYFFLDCFVSIWGLDSFLLPYQRIPLADIQLMLCY
ncbi:hypothetical protein Tco_1007329 [Tanacetum coccineum]